MRDILFRGKRKDNGEWVYGSLFVQEGEWITKTQRAPKEYYILGLKGEKNIVIPETLSQYSGLKDKNENRIFEGDIVEFISVDLCNPRIVATIKYGEYKNQPLCEGCNYSDWQVGFYMQSVKGQGSILLGSSEEKSIKNFGEVIGNIYDNPELLEAEE